MTEAFGQVALPLPLAQPYSYRIPEAIADRVRPGARVVVPVRQREMVGIVVELGPPPEGVEARDILSAPDAEPVLSLPLLETARWMAGYYAAPLGLTLKAMLPAALWGESRVLAELTADPDRVTGGLGGDVLTWLARKGGRAPVSAIARALKRPLWDAINRLVRVGAVRLDIEPAETERLAAHERVLALGTTPSLLERESLFKRAREQRRLYEAVEELGGRSPLKHLREQLGFSAAVIKGLVTRGLAAVEEESRLRDPFAGQAGTPPPADLTPDQTAALSTIAALAPGAGALLFGVTGSGKTLVYLEAIRAELARGRGAILLVPEISLTPQTVSRVRGAFGDQVAVLHSGLSDAERADAWRALRSGEKRVAVGARSAIFAPVQSLGVVVVDEEHEASYKNGESPRYHARDVAQVRVRLEEARLLLGSATPSPESFARVGERLTLIRLPERVGGRPMPPVEVIDLRHAPRVPETGPVPWSVTLDDAVQGTLARGEQALLLLNRRGFASFLQCPSCGAVAQCHQCSISLTVHQSPPGLRCHYCNATEPLARACAACGHAVQQMRGLGTQQLERLLVGRFPTARLARMDLDTTSTKWSHHRILEAVGQGEVDILLGTQMIAKGLDFPNVTLVGVVDADTGLYLPDFRSAERTFQLLAQVAGRAGRGPKGGRVIVQTYCPDHHAIRHAAAHDTEGFLAQELGYRQSPPYPPTVALANILVSGPDEVAVGTAAAEAAEWCRGLVEQHRLPITVLGPAASPLARIKGRWRWHVVLKGPTEEIGRVTRYAAGRITSGGEPRVVVDRDPGSML
jgi:primosomal protein N' (replication factor Y)